MKRLFSMLLVLGMTLSMCAVALTGCATTEKEEESSSKANMATTLVMWCVTEDGTDEEQAKVVADKMSEFTKAKLKAKLIVKYFTLDEYYENLEKALEAQEAAKKEAEEAAKKKKELEKAYKTTMTEEEKKAYDEAKKAEEEEKKRLEEEQKKAQEEAEKDDEVKYDEFGNPIIDKTIYPEVEDYQVDILYLSGYDKYKEYIKKEWLAGMNEELSSGSNKQIANFVPASLLNAVKYNGTTYAIPNNNVIGEYTYMMINKELYDKYYYTGYLDTVHNVVDLADFLEDVSSYEDGVLPIDGDVNYCLSLIADYWDINPETMQITGDFSILGYAPQATDKINRGDIALKFNSLLTDETYRDMLTSLMEYKFSGYFGTPEADQKCAVKFVTGDASLAAEYEDEYYPVVVDYPRAQDEDIYANMFAISAYTSKLSASMEVITLLNTDTEFRNLFQYGVEGVNYSKNSDGSVTMKYGNAYNMDLAKTGNEFIAYVPEGTNIQVWEYAKQQNRESLVSPLLGFDIAAELIDENDILEEDTETIEANKETQTASKVQEKYVVEKLDTDLIKYISDKSKEVWTKIEACQNSEELEALLKTLAKDLTATKDEKIKQATAYKMVEPEFVIDPDLNIPVIATDEDGKPKVADANVAIKVSLRTRTVWEKNEDGVMAETEKQYMIYNKTLNPYQIYYRWMNTYGFLPAGFEPVA